MPTVAIANRHAIFRTGLRELLAAEGDLTVAGEAADVQQAYDLLRVQPPDVLVLDLLLAGMAGFDDVTALVRASRRTRLLLRSPHDGEAYAVAAFQAGATGYVLEDAGAEELVRGIRAVANGQRYVSPPLTVAGLRTYMERARVDPELRPFR